MPRNSNCDIPLSDEEKIFLKKAARREGLPLATWIRHEILILAKTEGGDAQNE